MIIYIYIYIYIYGIILKRLSAGLGARRQASGELSSDRLPHRLAGRQIENTRSPLEDSRLFGPSPWKILATTYEQNDL